MVGGGRAYNWSLSLPTCTGASADSTLVGAELRRGPPTILLVLGQVLTLPWWWQSLEVVPVPSYLHWASADSTLVVAELRRGPPNIRIALVQVLTLPWWWQSLEVVPVPSYLHWGK